MRDGVEESLPNIRSRLLIIPSNAATNLSFGFSPPPSLSSAPGDLPSGASPTRSGTSRSRRLRTWGIPSGLSSGASLLGAPKSRSRSCVPTRRWFSRARQQGTLCPAHAHRANVSHLAAHRNPVQVPHDRRNLPHSRSLCVARRGASARGV
jgi:hypothetical protein